MNTSIRLPDHRYRRQARRRGDRHDPFYEREGLLPEPQRRASGYRSYDEGVIAQLRFIRRAKELGFTLEEIRELLALSARSPARREGGQAAGRTAAGGDRERLRRAAARARRAGATGRRRVPGMARRSSARSSSALTGEGCRHERAGCVLRTRRIAAGGDDEDPVCGMPVDPATAKHHADARRQDRVFLRRALPREIRRRAGRRIWHRARRTSRPPAGTIYTCPMHPEVQQVGPGDCPKCGMALEPMLPGAEDDDDGELASMTRRFWLLVALTCRCSLLAMGPHLFGWQLAAAMGARGRLDRGRAGVGSWCCGAERRSSGVAGVR